MTDLGITLDEARRHYERQGLEFQPYDLLDTPACTAKRGTARIVLEGTENLTYAAMTFPLDDLDENAMHELAELIAPDWDPVGGFVPDETESLSAKRGGVHIRFIRVPQIKRCLFTIQPCR